jgi:hypothetical protein
VSKACLRRDILGEKKMDDNGQNNGNNQDPNNPPENPPGVNQNPEPTGSDVPSDPVGEKITVTFEGALKGRKTITKGEKLNAAVSQLTDKPGTFQFSDTEGKSLGLTRVLNDNTKVSVVAKVSQG